MVSLELGQQGHDDKAPGVGTAQCDAMGDPLTKSDFMGVTDRIRRYLALRNRGTDR